MYGYALMCASTLRHAYEVALRYHALATPVVQIQWHEDASEVVWLLSSAQ